jgi:hypothetical protein
LLAQIARILGTIYQTLGLYGQAEPVLGCAKGIMNNRRTTFMIAGALGFAVAALP